MVQDALVAHVLGERTTVELEGEADVSDNAVA
jgi:hypothetical protein